MEYTTNYHLPQWQESDRIQMADFNQMCADMEAGLTAVQTEAETERQALSESLAELATTVSGHKIAVGKYTGNNGTKTISLDFTPTAVLVLNRQIDAGANYLYGFAITGSPAIEQYGSTTMLTIVTNGFKVVHGANASLSLSSYTYHYLAIC